MGTASAAPLRRRVAWWAEGRERGPSSHWGGSGRPSGHISRHSRRRSSGEAAGGRRSWDFGGPFGHWPTGSDALPAAAAGSESAASPRAAADRMNQWEFAATYKLTPTPHPPTRTTIDRRARQCDEAVCFRASQSESLPRSAAVAAAAVPTAAAATAATRDHGSHLARR